MNNPRNNRTDAERYRNCEHEVYTLPLTFWRDGSYGTVASPSTLYFRDESDRNAFASLFESVGYMTAVGERNI